jgi:serine/threonine protein phosphatase PrpC
VLLLLLLVSVAGEISKSTADGKPVGPDRVWPGGLAMSRTIGDPQAPQVSCLQEKAHGLQETLIMSMCIDCLAVSTAHRLHAAASHCSEDVTHARQLLCWLIDLVSVLLLLLPLLLLLLLRQVIAVPEIRHVTLPTTGGRLVIASDGVWDHMQPKSMIHQVSALLGSASEGSACSKVQQNMQQCL